jgi:hypothetical protein
LQRTSNPTFLSTISFRASDGVSDKTDVRLTVYDVRERTTGTQTVVGYLNLQLGSLKTIDRIRLPITLPTPDASKHHSTHPGFLSVCCWNLEREERSSTESTPCRLHPYDPNVNHPPSQGLVSITFQLATHKKEKNTFTIASQPYVKVGIYKPNFLFGQCSEL